MMRTAIQLAAVVLLGIAATTAHARFVSVDPVQANANNGTNFNRYYYANNNPYKFTDPDGRQSREFNWENQRLGVTTPPVDPSVPNPLEIVAARALSGFGDIDSVAPAGSGAVQSMVTPMEFSAAGGLARGLTAIGSAGEATALRSIATPHGAAIQANTPEAAAALQQVQNGAQLYRAGNFGVQNTGNAQFWSLQNPAATSGYAGQMGMPGVAAPRFDWVMSGRLTPGQGVITRPAPGLGANAGGAMEAVVNPGAVKIDWFTMP